jgi:hypothetical protein
MDFYFFLFFVKGIVFFSDISPILFSCYIFGFMQTYVFSNSFSIIETLSGEDC